jgi:hypothetical protein
MAQVRPDCIIGPCCRHRIDPLLELKEITLEGLENFFETFICEQSISKPSLTGHFYFLKSLPGY